MLHYKLLTCPTYRQAQRPPEWKSPQLVAPSLCLWQFSPLALQFLKKRYYQFRMHIWIRSPVLRRQYISTGKFYSAFIPTVTPKMYTNPGNLSLNDALPYYATLQIADLSDVPAGTTTSWVAASSIGWAVSWSVTVFSSSASVSKKKIFSISHAYLNQESSTQTTIYIDREILFSCYANFASKSACWTGKTARDP